MAITVDRVTITLPRSLVKAIERVDSNRSGFLAKAAKRELRRRRRLALKHALDAAQIHAVESRELAEMGLKEWAAGLPDEDVSKMVDLDGGTPVRWVPGEGWIEEKGPK